MYTALAMIPKTASLWRNHHFLLVWGGQSISLIGSRLTFIALMWWTLEATGSAAILASAAIAAAVPSLLLGPIAGTFIDRLDRRKLMLAMNLASMLIVGTAATLLFLGRLQVWQVYIIFLLRSTAKVFHQPSLQASIPNLVTKDQLTKANSLYQISAGTSGILGPALGGLLVGLVGSGLTMWVDAITFFLAGISLLLASFTSPCAATGKGWKSVLKDTLFGLRFLYSKKVLFALLLLFALVNFIFAPITVLLPIMAMDILDVGAKGFGLLSASISAGLLIGGLLTSRLKRFKHYGLGIIWALVLIGGMLALFGLSRNLFLSMGILTVLGIAVAIINIFEIVIFQTRIPNELQGRIFAADSAISFGLEPISLAATGGLLTIFTAPAVVVGCGLAAIVAGLGGYWIKGLKGL